MREILFRGKQISDGEWVYGYFAKDGIGKCFITSPEKGSSDVSYQSIVFGETVGQYTGLTDKNGKKIFEGQYLYVPYNGIGFVKVKFENGKFNAAGYNLSSCTVYDNPKLMKESDNP